MNLENRKLNEVLDYKQPTKYIVETTDYDDSFETPVLTAGKSFLLGYTNDKTGIFTDVPAIIFDDFTTSFHYVDFPFKVKSSAMKILTAKEDFVDLKYVYLQMQQVRIDTQLHKRYWISKFSNKEIPVPKVDIQNNNTKIQQRIAAILDDAAALRDKTAQLLTEYDLLAQSIFLEMFGDTYSNPKNFPIMFIEELAANRKHSIKAGPFGSSLKKEFYVESGYKIYGQEQVIKDDLSFGNYYIDEARFQKLNSCEVFKGDILVSLVGTYGKISVVPESFEPGIINPRLMKISPNQDMIRPDFLKIVLQSDGVAFQLKNKSRGGTMDIINVGIIRKVKTAVPPLELQNQFAEKIALIEQQKALAKQELQESEDLFNCLLQKAFKGEL